MGRYDKLYLLFLFGSILFAGLAAWAAFHGLKRDLPIPPSAIANDSGPSYACILPEFGYWPFETLSDNSENPYRAKTKMFENDAPLGPPHSRHDSIRNTGSGQFSHWGSSLYFSASDSSDPRTNGRHYRVVLAATIPTWLLAVPALCLLSSLYLNRRIIVRFIMMFVPRTRAGTPSAIDEEIRWRWGVLAGIAMALLSLYPQIDLWVTRKAAWEGTYASVSYDEEMYASYINGLILGRPRRHLPQEIPDPSRPSHESPLSMQMVPAYFVAMPARVLGLKVAGIFVLLTPVMAFISTLILFYLIASVARDNAFAAAGALAVLVLGTLAARHSVVVGWLGRSWYGSFLFLRRYMHAVAFPIFLAFITVTWRGFISKGRKSRLAAIAASALFVLLVFSYFFLWTAALAWLACFSMLWLIAKPGDWAVLGKRLTPTALIGIPALTIYAVLFFQRDPEIDKTHALELTRAPDLHRAPIWIAMGAILLLTWALKRRCVHWREPHVLLVLSFAMLPFAVFNQQIITGRSLQPEHYEMYSANYLSIVALILAWLFLWRRRPDFSKRRVPRFLLVILLPFMIGWGAFEMYGVTLAFRERNIDRDRFVPVARRLSQLAAEHHLSTNEREVVFSPDVLVVSENVAASAPQVPLMTTNLPLAGGLSGKEWRERYFQYLYYSGARPNDLMSALANHGMVSTMSMFGYERYNPGFTRNFKQITSKEIDDRVREYVEYAASFDHERARQPKLSYLVLRSGTPFDFSNIDHWYSRDRGESIGPFTLYQLQAVESDPK